MFTCSSKGEAPGGVEEGVVLAVVVLLAGGAVRRHQEGPGGAAHAAALNPLQPCAYSIDQSDEYLANLITYFVSNASH